LRAISGYPWKLSSAKSLHGNRKGKEKSQTKDGEHRQQDK
jgi:hypothetical protein